MTANDRTEFVLREQVRAAIDAEPELPCEMPEEIWDMLRSDERAAAEVMRANVRAMKINIKARLGL
jgi:metal-dependent HD superfamily phosphatase/phosphodiesterase